jgi:hypothetical protein
VGVYLSVDLCPNIAEVAEVEIVCKNIGYTTNYKVSSQKSNIFSYEKTELSNSLEKIKKIALRHREESKKEYSFDSVIAR